MWDECTDSAVLSKGRWMIWVHVCTLYNDPLSRRMSLKDLVQETKKTLYRERSNPCCPGVSAVPGFSLFLALHCTALPCTELHSTELQLYNTALHGMNYTALNYTALNYTALNYTAKHCMELFWTNLNCKGITSTVLHGTDLLDPVLHVIVLHCTVPNCMVLYCTALHWTVQQCTALHCTALHCTVEVEFSHMLK